MNKEIRFFDRRYKYIVAFIALLMIVLVARLFVLTVIENDKWSKKATDQSTKTVYTSASRGNIYDRNGKLLASSKQIFVANFSAGSLSTEEINESALALINKLTENGDEYTDDFAIKIDSAGNYIYTFDTDTKDWLTSHGYSENATAQMVFDKVRNEYNIDPDLDRYEAMEIIEDKYSVYLPISVKTMEFTYELQKRNFWSKFGFSEKEIKKGMTAEKCFKKLRKKYKVDKSLSDMEARKIFVVRDKIADNGFNRYTPITMATDISNASVVYFEENALPGVSVDSSTERYYPNGSVACHVIGYMGSISESEAKTYNEEKGYLSSDLVGKDGIEAALEEELHGMPGIEKIMVNSSGQYVETVSKTKAQKGSDVYLTLDLDLQKVTEESLKEAILGSEQSGSGAAIAINPKTGEVLAMASYPGFDLNQFADGISTKEWESVQPTNPRDALAPAPLYNNATMASVPPGSTFKPITSFAALECGLDPNRSIVDGGYIELGGRKFGCDLWNNYGSTHGAETLEWGIGNSCNYYFYCIATNKDWGTGASLGYTENMSVEKIMDTAKKFGLAEASGIEIPEVVRSMADSDYKMRMYKLGAWNAIYEESRTYFPKEVYEDYDRLSENISKITSWTEENPDYDELIKRIKKETEVKEDKAEELASMVKFDYFNQAAWSTADAFNTAIGQGYNAYTPVQMVRYLGTIANGGKLNDITLVYGVENEGRNTVGDGKQIDISETDRQAVLKGMKRVAKSGTLSFLYSSYPIEVAGKTGTAEYAAIKQPKSEVDFVKAHLSSLNGSSGASLTWEEVEKKMKEMMLDDPKTYATEDDAVDTAVFEASDHKITQSMINSLKGTYESFSWTMAFAPADDPEIAIVVMLVEGGYSSTAAPVTKDILSAYFGLEKKTSEKSTTYKKTDNLGKNTVQ